MYFLCETCDLVFVGSEFHLQPEEEQSRYDFHENDLEDPGYRKFLNRLAQPMLSHIPPGASGLDFGCGPGPLLKQIFEEAGHTMAVYDPFYANNPTVLDTNYDFISASEVAEHLFNPGHELSRLFGMLSPGGVLGLMTSLRGNDISFPDWHYIRDDTHVVFYSPRTMDWLARKWGATLLHMDESVIIFKKEPYEGLKPS